MLRFLTGLCAALILALPSLAAAAPQVRVDVTRTAEGLRLTYRLPAPVSRFDFQGEIDVSDRAVMRLATPGLVREGLAIKADKPFSSFVLEVSPDPFGGRDARYALMTRVGPSGLVLYMPALQPAGGSARFSFPERGGDVVRAGDAARGGLLYFGPKAWVREARAATLIVPPDAPAWLAQAVEERTERLLGFYAGKLGRAAPHRPLVVLSYDASTGPAGNFIGDVTPNGIILLTFRGAALAAPSADFSGRLSSFLAHETFHLWNGLGLGGKADEAWVHEGGAEYASYLAASTLWPDEVRLEDRMGGQLTACADANRRKGLTAITGESAARMRYTCGTVAEWLADIHIRAASSGKDDIFALWRRLLAAPDGYGAAEFRSAAAGWSSPAEPSLAAFLDGTEADRWPAILGPLKAFGVETEPQAPPNGAYVGQSLFPLLFSVCTGPTGFFNNPDGIQVDPTATCTALKGGPYVLGVADHPMDEGAAMFDAVEKACAAKAEVTVRLRGPEGERSEAVRCAYDARRPAPGWRIGRALPPAPGA